MGAKNFLNVVLLLLILLVWLSVSAAAQDGRGASVGKLSVTNTVGNKSTSGKATSTQVSAVGGYERISFETLAAFPIKVDWLINPTNSALDTLSRKGEIPALIKALNGKRVSVQGNIKPLKQGDNGVSEFLLMRNHALCCQTNVPEINEWVHVRLVGNEIPYVHEHMVTVSGVLQVGELLGTGNVVSVYRLTGDEITTANAP